MFKLTAASVLAFSFLTATAHADALLDSEWSLRNAGQFRHLVNRAHGYCLGVPGVDSHPPGVRAEVYHCNPPNSADPGLDNMWQFRDLGNGGYYHIVNRVNGYCLGVSGVDNHGAGTQADVYHCNPPDPADPGLDNQWRVERAASGFRHIRNRVSGLCLGVRGFDSHAPGATVEVYHCSP